ncbi:MAG: DNA-directed RNA polymerase, partial [Candidatus Bathyarchaeia archaeon]
LGKESKRKLSSSDQVRVRITAVSMGRAGSSGKIGVTARQPFLGKLDWLKEDQAKKVENKPEASTKEA